MKWIILSIIALGPCKQTLYDALYENIIRDALDSKVYEKPQMDLRNDKIRLLRELCWGQKSTFERGKQ